MCHIFGLNVFHSNYQFLTISLIETLNFFGVACPIWLPLFFCYFFCHQVVHLSTQFLGDAGIQTQVQGPWLRLWVLDVYHETKGLLERYETNFEFWEKNIFGK